MTEPHRTVFRTPDGLDLVADRYGTPIRGGVLLAHGGGQTRHAWAKTAAALADRGWEAVALDLRGHGDSGWSPTGDYQMERFAGDLAICLLYTSPSPRDRQKSRMPSSA